MTQHLPSSLIFISLFIILFTLINLSERSHFTNFYKSTSFFNRNFSHDPWIIKKQTIDRSNVAICLVGGARRFELTGPSIIKNILNEYPYADLFLNSYLTENSYKFSILGNVSRIAAVRVVSPRKIEETEEERRVLTFRDSPNGIQGLLQYFNLVEGCLDLIRNHESKSKKTYDWIVRTRVDGYWSSPLSPFLFDPSSYIVPIGSRYHGLNDRLGIGIVSSSSAALSRLSLVPRLDSSGYRNLNSEAAFKAQLEVTNTSFMEVQVPFCILSDRKYEFPPKRPGVPVAPMNSSAPLSGAKCRPCRPKCKGKCAEKVLSSLDETWGWIEWRNNDTGNVELCDASKEWEDGWENMFDELSGEDGANVRKMMKEMRLEDCLKNWDVFKGRVRNWEGPNGDVVCRLGGFDN